MPGKTRATEAQVGKERRSKQTAVEMIGRVGDPVALLAEPGAAFGSGSAVQAARLANPRFQVAQRQALAARIGRVQGNGHLQRLVASLGVATEPLEEPATSIPSTEPLEEEVTSSPTMGPRLPVAHSEPKDVSPEQRPPPVLVPVDPSRAGACVICNGGDFDVWINPAMPACTHDCMTQHEEKHIVDFMADDDYKDKCLSTPDGETFYYNSMDDARRFEHPAIDIEIACIEEQLKTETDEENEKILKRRAEVVLPRYRESFG